MAHFIEHMLFLGNEKYPEEGEFQQYLNQYGGNSDADTRNGLTMFHFDSHFSSLKKALDM